MQMVNIFNEHGIPTYFFKRCDMAVDLRNYIFDNLQKENNISTRDLEIALTINANGEYIY
jgi:hypothetical protein